MLIYFDECNVIFVIYSWSSVLESLIENEFRLLISIEFDRYLMNFIDFVYNFVFWQHFRKCVMSSSSLGK